MQKPDLKPREIQVAIYRRAQLAVAELKAAVLELLSAAGDEGLKNSQVGRALGVYRGHVGHQGHISRTILEMLKEDEVVEQDGETSHWRLRPVSRIPADEA